jgi:hypothetical protein
MTIPRSDPPIFAPDLPGADASICHDAAQLGERLLDDAHTAWLIAASEAEQTLHAWSERASGTCASRYRAYLAAVDREEAAARDLQRLHEIASAYLRRYAGLRRDESSGAFGWEDAEVHWIVR